MGQYSRKACKSSTKVLHSEKGSRLTVKKARISGTYCIPIPENHGGKYEREEEKKGKNVQHADDRGKKKDKWKWNGEKLGIIEG
jgi:hypothetical protein